MNLEVLVADLHIHSVLSPCARRDMLPQCIVLEALEKGIGAIALTDHNACDNVAVTLELGERFGLWVIPGIEIETREEIHLLSYFPTLELLVSFNRVVEEYLLSIPLERDVWGEEWVIDEEGNVREKKTNLLTVPLSLSLEEVVREVECREGVIVPAHVDRKSYSIISQLGFIPPGLSLRALEVSSFKEIGKMDPSLRRYALLSFSDAHTLEEVGYRTTSFFVASRSFDEFLLALSGEKERKVLSF